LLVHDILTPKRGQWEKGHSVNNKKKHTGKRWIGSQIEDEGEGSVQRCGGHKYLAKTGPRGKSCPHFCFRMHLDKRRRRKHTLVVGKG